MTQRKCDDKPLTSVSESRVEVSQSMGRRAPACGAGRKLPSTGCSLLGGYHCFVPVRYPENTTVVVLLRVNAWDTNDERGASMGKMGYENNSKLNSQSPFWGQNETKTTGVTSHGCFRRLFFDTCVLFLLIAHRRQGRRNNKSIPTMTPW